MSGGLLVMRLVGFQAMRDVPDDSNATSHGAAAPPAGAARPGNRTAAAGREFLQALRGDLASLAAKSKESVMGARRRMRVITAGRRIRGGPPAGSQVVRTAGAPWVRAGGQVLGRVGLMAMLAVVAATLLVSGGMLWALHDLPLDRPNGEPDRPAFLLEAANGEPLGRVGPLRETDAALQDFPKTLIQAVLSIEDRRFYAHFGVDPLGILRAAHRNMRADGIVEGGSTITQQLVKLRYIGNDRTYARKLREALTATWVEARLSKDEILRLYLNSVYMGAGAYGMAAGARLYFDKRPANLTLAEAAMLAGIIKAPSQLNPLRHLEAAQRRAATVLDAMVDNGVIDRAAADAAQAQPATLKLSPQMAQAGSWFTDWIGRQAAEATNTRTGILRVRTTLRPDLQRLAQEAVETTLARDGRRLGVSQAALVAMRPDGAVVAMVGGRDYGTTQFNRAVEASRHPGSAFKLFVYLAALRKGYAPGDMIDASAIDVKGWEPDNHGSATYGRMTLADAFARSVNTAAVRLAMNVGLKDVIAAARDLGIDAPLSPLPSLALGAVGVSLLDLTGAFASVRANRLRLEPWAIAAAAPTADAPLRTAGPPLTAGGTLDPYQRPLVDLLRGVVERGTGRGAALDGFAAGKTGTSQDYRDAWFVGFNDALVVGVWVGNDDNAPMKQVVGGSLPASIWKAFMTAATPLAGKQDVRVAAAPPAAPAPTTDGSGKAPTPDVAAKADSDPKQSGFFPFGRSGADQTRPAVPERSGAARCDVQACAAAYNSFRASDCTYQPFAGRRRVCEMGGDSPPSTETRRRDSGEARAQAQCNIQVCASRYSSFDPSTCTYQPYDGGPRQFCAR